MDKNFAQALGVDQDLTKYAPLLEELHKAEKVYDLMYLLQSTMAGLTSWAVGLMAIFSSYSDTIVQVLGFILLVARMVQEVPKAYKAVKGWFRWSRKQPPQKPY